MPRRSKIIILVPIALLLARNFIPAALGQLIQSDWSRNADFNLYRPTMNSVMADRPVPKYRSQYWMSSPGIDAGNSAFLISTPQLKSVEVRSQQIAANPYPLLERFFPPSPFHGLANVQGVDVTEMLSSKTFQQPKKRQNQVKDMEDVMDGNSPQIDYSSDDDTLLQHLRPTAKSEDYTLMPPSQKAKIKTKATATDGFSRYFIFSNLKRARDGYICHFKLCQVGVSGKRLSNN